MSKALKYRICDKGSLTRYGPKFNQQWWASCQRASWERDQGSRAAARTLKSKAFHKTGPAISLLITSLKGSFSTSPRDDFYFKLMPEASLIKNKNHRNEGGKVRHSLL